MAAPDRLRRTRRERAERAGQQLLLAERDHDQPGLGRDGAGGSTGRKFYSTGSLFADWIHTTATVDSGHSADRAGADVGAGRDPDRRLGRLRAAADRQRHDRVRRGRDPPEDVEIYPTASCRAPHLIAFFQLVHLATLAGIGRARGGRRGRRTSAGGPATSPTRRTPRPKDDPQVQQVVRATGLRVLRGRRDDAGGRGRGRCRRTRAGDGDGDARAVRRAPTWPPSARRDR